MPLRDEDVRRLVMTNPIPDDLVTNLGGAVVPRYTRKYAGRRVYSAEMPRNRRRVQMTPALWETLKLVAAGYTVGRIAEELGVSFPAAQDRTKRLLAYFDARDRLEIAVRCYREGIM